MRHLQKGKSIGSGDLWARGDDKCSFTPVNFQVTVGVQVEMQAAVKTVQICEQKVRVRGRDLDVPDKWTFLRSKFPERSRGLRMDYVFQEEGRVGEEGCLYQQV